MEDLDFRASATAAELSSNLCSDYTLYGHCGAFILDTRMAFHFHTIVFDFAHPLGLVVGRTAEQLVVLRTLFSIDVIFSSGTMFAP